MELKISSPCGADLDEHSSREDSRIAADIHLGVTARRDMHTSSCLRLIASPLAS